MHRVEGIDFSANVMDWIVTKNMDCTSEPKAKKYYQYVRVGRPLKLKLEVIMCVLTDNPGSR